MKEKYYMKDVMAKFCVSRDTIKYYEKQGIIEGFRDSNGYRYYDYLSMKRMERVFWLRSVGFSIEQIKHFLEGLSLEEELQLNKERMQELERQIKNLSAQLEFFKYLDSWEKNVTEKYRQYQICDNFEICVGCEKSSLEKAGWMMQREMKILYFNDDYSIAHEELYENVAAQQTIRLNEHCQTCDSNLKICRKAACGVIKKNELHKLKDLVLKIQEDIQDEYVLGHKAYCLDGYYIEAEPREEGVAIEFYIPITKKEGTI